MVDAPTIPSWLAQLYPFTPRGFITPAGARMSYLDEGPRRDEAVLMLHGNPTWSFYYRNLVQALALTERCVVPDHIGMGLSAKPADYAYTLQRRIDDIAALVASLGLRRISLVVHDWGGAIGCGLAVRHPELVRRIVILNTAAFAAEWIPARISLCKLPVLGPLLVRGLNGFAWPATWMGMHRRGLTAGEKRAYLFPYDSWANRRAVSEFVRDIPLHPSHPSWHTLATVERGLVQLRRKPAMILWGGRDFCFHDRFLARWRELWPEAEVERFEDVGHYILEDARDQVVPRITRFLTAR
jgi:haloalkane dehalogenase